MKNLKIILGLLMMTNYIYSQTTKEIFSLPGFEIIMVAINSADAPDSNMSLYFESEETYCGESLLKFNTSYGEEIYLNIQDGKVMVVDSCVSERLLFDFDINVGDSITHLGRTAEVVSVGDTLLNDNILRKTYSIKAPDGVSPDTELFIEGIGSQFTGLDYTDLNSGFSTYFSCVNDSNGEIHLSPFANPVICEMFSRITSSTINSIRELEPSIYPNPTHGELRFKNLSNLYKKMNVYNSQGLLVCSKKLNSETNNYNLEYLVEGIYFIELLDSRNQTISQSRLVKM